MPSSIKGRRTAALNLRPGGIASKIAVALNVSLDYLVGNTELLLDASILKRIQDIQKLKEEDKSHVFAMLDAFLLKSNIKDNLVGS